MAVTSNLTSTLEFTRPGRADIPALDGGSVPLLLVLNRKARRYILRVTADGVARVTVPRGGSISGAKSFAEKHIGWLQQQRQRVAACPPSNRAWQLGTPILFRGELTPIEPVDSACPAVRVGSCLLPVQSLAGDLRPEIEHGLRRIATPELIERTTALAAAGQFPVRRISVRNQRSRWGSCSRRGTISLNWRLVQAPLQVRDYLIFHELAHLKHMNHSARFWAEVERLCPDYRVSEAWLKHHSRQLL